MSVYFSALTGKVPLAGLCGQAPTERIPRPRQPQTDVARQTEFVICD